MFEEKVTEIVGLYLDPPERAVVLCVDETSQIQALDRTQPGLPLQKGRAPRSLGQLMDNLLRFHGWSLHKYATRLRGYETPDVSHTHSVGNTRTAPLSADDANKA